MAGNINTNVNLNVKSTGTKRATKDINALNSALRKIGASSDNSTKGSDKLNRSTTRLGQSSASAGRQFSAQAAGLGGLVGAYAGAAATVFALQQAFSALNRAAQVDNIIRGTQTLAAKVGENGNQILQSLQDITQGQVALGEAAEKANLALSTGFSTKQIEQLANISTKVSVALGRNLSDAFERLTRGAAKLEPELLDELGIFTKLEPATKAYAKEIGKAVNDLTEFERRQAFVNAIIEEGNRKFSEIDTSAPSAQKSLNRLSATLQDLGHKFGVLAAEALVPVIDFFTKDFTGAISIFALVARQLASSGLTSLTAGINSFSASLDSNIARLGDQISASKNSRQAMEDFSESVKNNNNFMVLGNKAQTEQALKFKGMGAASTLAATDLKSFIAVQQEQINIGASRLVQLDKENKSLIARSKLGPLTSPADIAALKSYSTENEKLQANQFILTKRINDANVALVAQSTKLKAVAVASRVAAVSVRALTRAFSVLLRVLNVALLALSFGPLLLNLVGQIGIFNTAINYLKDTFLALRNANKDLELGIRALGARAEVGISNITEQYKQLGLSAREAADAQESAIKRVAAALKDNDSKIDEVFGTFGGTAAMAGLMAVAAGVTAIFSAAAAGIAAIVVGGLSLIDMSLAYLFGYESISKKVASSAAEALGGPSKTLKEGEEAAASLRKEVEELQDSFNRTGDLALLQEIDQINAFRDAILDTDSAVTMFTGTLSRLTGQDASLIDELLGTTEADFSDTSLKLGGLEIATREVGKTFTVANESIGLILPTFVGFESTLLRANNAMRDGSVSSKSFVEIINSLRTSQSNLSDTIDIVTSRISIQEQKIKKLNAEGTEEARVRADELVNSNRDLITTLGALETRFEETTNRLNELSEAGDQANKSLVKFQNIQKVFKSAADTITNAKFKGLFVETAEGLEFATSSTQKFVNQVNSLKNELVGIGGLTDLEDNVTAFEKLGQVIRSDDGSVTTTTDRAAKAVRELNLAVANREFMEKSIKGLLLGQVEAVKQQTRELEKQSRIARQQLQQATLKAEIDISKARLTSLNKARAEEISIKKVKADGAAISSELAATELSISRDILSERANAIDIQQEQLKIVSQIAEERIKGAKEELSAQKQMISLAKEGLAFDDSFFDKDMTKILNLLADIGSASLDVEISQKETDLAEKQAETAAELAKLEANKQIFAAEILAKEQELSLLEIDSRVADLTARIEISRAERQNEIDSLTERRSIAELEAKLKRETYAANLENKREELKILEEKRQDTIKLVESFNNLTTDMGTEFDTFISELQATLSTQKIALEAKETIIADPAKDKSADPVQSSADALNNSADSLETVAEETSALVKEVSTTGQSSLDSLQALETSAQATNEIAEITNTTLDTTISNKKIESDLISKNEDERLAALGAESTALKEKHVLETENSNAALETANKTAELEKDKAKNAEAALQAQIKANQLAQRQAAFQIMNQTGTLLRELSVGRAEKARDKAAENRDKVLSKQEEVLSRVSSLRSSEADAMAGAVDILKERRALERDIISSIADSDASGYLKTTEAYFKNLNDLDEQTKVLSEAQANRAIAEAELAIQDYKVIEATNNLSSAEKDLENAHNSLVGRTGDVLQKFGSLGNSMVSLVGLAQQLTGAFTTLGNTLVGSVTGDSNNEITEAVKDGFDKSKAAETSAQVTGNIVADLKNVVVGSVRDLGGAFERFNQESIGAAGGAAQYFAESDGGLIDFAAAGLGKAVTPMITGIIEDFITTALGPIGNIAMTAIDFIAGDFISGLIGDALEGIVNFFSPRKRNRSTADLTTGDIIDRKDSGVDLDPVAKSAFKMNQALETVTGGLQRFTEAQAILTTKGSDIREKFLELRGGGADAVSLDFDSENFGKELFEGLIRGLDPISLTEDMKDAIGNMDFSKEIENNMKDLNFAKGFDGLMTQLESAGGKFTNLGEFIDLVNIKAEAAAATFAQGALQQTLDLIEEAGRVFGEQSEQVGRAKDAAENMVLAHLDLHVAGDRTVSLLSDTSTNLSGMAMAMETVKAEMNAMQDALEATGVNAGEAARIIEEGIALKITQMAQDFGDALSDVIQFGDILESSAVQGLKDVLEYQQAIIRDAAYIQEQLGNGYDFIARAEKALAIQRGNIVGKASDQELRALSELAGAGQEFSNAAMKAATDAELTRRVMNNIFEGAKQLTQAQRSSRSVGRGLAFAEGGFVPGTPEQQNKDSVPALLMPGEYVLNKKAVKNVGVGTLAAFNSGAFKKMEGGGSPTGGVIAPDKVATDAFGGTFGINAATQALFKNFSQDMTTTLEFYEAREIVAQANIELFETYSDLREAAGASNDLMNAFSIIVDHIERGEIGLATAVFDIAHNLTEATSATEAYTLSLSQNQAQQALASAGVNLQNESIGTLTDNLTSFYNSINTSSVTAGDLEAVISQMNIALSQGVIFGNEYGSILDDVTSDFDNALASLDEYSSFFLELQDMTLDPTGIISSIRSVQYAFEDGMNTMTDAVTDGFIDTIDASTVQVRLNKRLEKERIDLIKNSSDEQLRIIRDTQDSIADATFKTGAIAEIAVRKILAVSSAFGTFEQGLVGFYNNLVQSSGNFTRTLSASVVSSIQAAGIIIDDELDTNFLGTLTNFATLSKSGSSSVHSLSTALEQLNYQLEVGETIDTDTYKEGVAFLQSSFMEFLDLFSGMSNAFREAESNLDNFKTTLHSSFTSITDELEDLLKTLVTTYRTTLADVKTMYQEAVAQQKEAEESLYGVLFSAQTAFIDAGGHLEGHISRIDDIVKGLDPTYQGYAGLDQYLKQLQIDVQAGITSLGNINTSQSLSALQTNLANSLADLAILQTLPDSADKFVKISRKLSEIDDINNQISAGTQSTDALKEATLDLLKVEEELNFNNTTAGLQQVDLTLQGISQDLLQNAIDARTAFNTSNQLLDDFTTALNANFTPNLVASTTAVNSSTLSLSSFIAEMQSANQVFSDITTAVSAINATGIQEIIDTLDVISNPADEVNIDVVDTSYRGISDLNDILNNFTGIVAAKTAFENLYGSIAAVTPVVPLQEFNDLNAEFINLENTITSLLGTMGNSNIADIDATFEQFVLDSIALLQNPLTLSGVSTSGSTTNIAAQAITGSGAVNNPQISTQTSLLQQILTQGLGVQSPGYLFYTNQILEQIRTVLEDMLILQGGTLPTYANITSTFTSPTTSTGGATTTTVPTGSTTGLPSLNQSGILGLTGQLFEVEEPITRPADYFYIVIPKLVAINEFYIVEPIEVEYDFFFDLTPVSVTSIDAGNGGPHFFNITTVDTDFDKWFNAPTLLDTDYNSWFNDPTLIDTSFTKWLKIIEEETGIFDWITITKSAANYQTFFEAPTKVDHSVATWYNLPTKLDNTANLWYNLPTKKDVDYTDWFTLTKVAVKYSEFFDPEDKINLTDHIGPVTVDADSLFTINKSSKDADDLYSITSIEKDYSTFFKIAAKDFDYTDFFKIVEKDITDFIQISKSTKTAIELFTIQKSEVTGSTLFSITADSVAASTLITVKEDNRIQVGADEIFDKPTSKMALSLLDIFSNYESGAFDWTKAVISVGQVINEDKLKEGLANKAILATGDIFDNWNGKGFDIDSVDISYLDLFKLEVKDIEYTTLFKLPTDADKKSLHWSSWFKVDPEDKMDASDLFTFISPEPVSALALFSPTSQSVDGSTLFVLSNTLQKIDANNLYDVAKVSKTATDFFTISGVQLKGEDFIDLTYLANSKYVAEAKNVLDVDGKLTVKSSDVFKVSGTLDKTANQVYNITKSDKAGADFWEVTASEQSGASFFTPTKSELAGLNFFSPTQSTITASDLFNFNKVKIDVSTMFESELSTLTDAVNDQDSYLITNYGKLETIKSYTKVSSEKLTNIAKADSDFHAAILEDTAYLETIATSLGDLADIKANTADIKTNTSVNVSKLTKIENHTDGIEGKLDHISDDLDAIAKDLADKLNHISDNLDHISNNLDTLETTANAIEGYVLYLPGMSTELTAQGKTLVSIDGVLDAIEIDTSNMVTYLESIATNSAYLKTIDQDTSHLKTNADNKTSHISDNLDHLSNNLDAIITNTNKNKTRYKYSGATKVSLATGGPVVGPGTSTSDSVRANLSNGEYVIKASSAKSMGRDVLDTLNSTGSIASLGRKGDTELAHINSVEAQMLKSIGGSGFKNPLSGLKEFFFDGFNPLLGLRDAALSAATSIISNTNQPEGWSPEKIGSNASWNTANFANNTFAKKVLVELTRYIAANRDGKAFTHSQAFNSISDAWFEYDKPNIIQFNRGSSFNNDRRGTSNINSLITRLQNDYPSFADGGRISGAGTSISDSIMAMLSDGEYIIRNSSVDNVGVNTLDYINNTGQLPQGDTNVEVNITNNGSPVDVEAEPKVSIIDGKVVVDVILKDLRTNGPIKKTIKKIK